MGDSMNKKTVGYLLVSVGSVCLVACGAIFARAIKVEVVVEEDSAIPDEIRSRVYAFQFCLMKQHNGEYDGATDDEAISNDFEFAKMAYYMKKR